MENFEDTDWLLIYKSKGKTGKKVNFN